MNNLIFNIFMIILYISFFFNIFNIELSTYLKIFFSYIMIYNIYRTGLFNNKEYIIFFLKLKFTKIDEQTIFDLISYNDDYIFELCLKKFLERKDVCIDSLIKALEYTIDLNDAINNKNNAKKYDDKANIRNIKIIKKFIETLINNSSKINEDLKDILSKIILYASSLKYIDIDIIKNLLEKDININYECNYLANKSFLEIKHGDDNIKELILEYIKNKQ